MESNLKSTKKAVGNTKTFDTVSKFASSRKFQLPSGRSILKSPQKIDYRTIRDISFGTSDRTVEEAEKEFMPIFSRFSRGEEWKSSFKKFIFSGNTFKSMDNYHLKPLNSIAKSLMTVTNFCILYLELRGELPLASFLELVDSMLSYQQKNPSNLLDYFNKKMAGYDKSLILSKIRQNERFQRLNDAIPEKEADLEEKHYKYALNRWNEFVNCKYRRRSITTKRVVYGINKENFTIEAKPKEGLRMIFNCSLSIHKKGVKAYLPNNVCDFSIEKNSDKVESDFIQRKKQDFVSNLAVTWERFNIITMKETKEMGVCTDNDQIFKETFDFVIEGTNKEKVALVEEKECFEINRKLKSVKNQGTQATQTDFNVDQTQEQFEIAAEKKEKKTKKKKKQTKRKRNNFASEDEETETNLDA